MINFNLWSNSVAIIALVIIAPIFSIFYYAILGDTSLWPHLFSTVLPRYLTNTIILMFGVGGLSLVFGLTTAWIVTRYNFFGKKFFEWMLLLPAAVPAYIIAYTYTDFFEYAGPLQSLLRDIFGWTSSKDYWFPNVRSMGGAILVMSSVLYPYVYLMTRASFITTPISFFQTSSIYGRNSFFNVAIPFGRPGIIAGLALVLMETISDFGTVDYFAIETLTLGVFNVWLGMNSLSGASQISSILFMIVIVLLTLEYLGRRSRKFHEKYSGASYTPTQTVSGIKNSLLFLICLIPLSLAVGIVVFVGWLNDLIYFRMSYAVGGFIILLFAYSIRFLAVGNGAITSGISRIHPNLLDASRTMGVSFFKSIRKIILPLLYTNLLVGGILVFVDILKELPITLLLRPFNFETLATYVYQYASDEMLEESAFAALIIVIAGLGPVIFLNRTITKSIKN